MNQDNSLTGEGISLDNSTKENMENLMRIGQELLKKPASRVDPETGLLDAIPNMGTNADVITRFQFIFLEKLFLFLLINNYSLHFLNYICFFDAINKNTSITSNVLL